MLPPWGGFTERFEIITQAFTVFTAFVFIVKLLKLIFDLLYL